MNIISACPLMLFIYISSFYSLGFHMKSESDMFTKTRRSRRENSARLLFNFEEKHERKKKKKFSGERATQRHARLLKHQRLFLDFSSS